MIFFLLRWLQARQLASLRAKTKPGYYSQAEIARAHTDRKGNKNGTYD